MSNTIIFLGSPERLCKGHSPLQNVKSLFFVSMYNIGLRIFMSFMPPFSTKFQKVYVDFLGPLLALVVLSGILHYGHNYKNEAISFGPSEFVLTYSFVMPFLCFVLLKLSSSVINLSEIVSLLGYAMYGHILTICMSLLFFDENSNLFFFFSLIVFSGLSTFRLAVIFLKTIPKPGARFLVCTLVGTIQILLLVFMHFAYMHKTFIYGKKIKEFRV